MPKQLMFRGGSEVSGAESTSTILHSEGHILLQWQTQMLACVLLLSKSFRLRSGAPLLEPHVTAIPCLMQPVNYAAFAIASRQCRLDIQVVVKQQIID